jgi:hypothetical protein
MRLRTVGLFVMTLTLSAASAGAKPGNGHGPGPKTCDPADLVVIHDAVMAACPCETATNHGQFVSCAGRVLLSAMKGGTLPRECQHLARRGVAKSSCGKPGFVTCCRTGVSAAAGCTVKRDAATCVAAGGCVGSSSTCMDACASACGSPSGAFLDSGSLF